MEWVIALVALALMEIILGIDNIVFLAIVTGKLPEQQRPLARRIGLLLAMGMRIGLLFAISFVMSLTSPIIHLTDVGAPPAWFAAEGEDIHLHADDKGHMEANKLSYEANKVSWRDLILIVGGLFLIGKSVWEIHEKLDHDESEDEVKAATSFASALFQIALLDIIFSLDSVITAVGMAEDIRVMIAAVVISIGVMLVFANAISDFVSKNPSLTMLALSFLILIGVMLVAEGIGTHVNKGYIYFAMAFSLIVEILNLRIRGGKKAAKKVEVAGA